MDEGDQKVQPSCDKINKPWEYSMCSSKQYWVIYLKVAQRVNLKISHHKKNICSDIFFMLTRLTVVFILQYYIY